MRYTRAMIQVVSRFGWWWWGGVFVFFSGCGICDNEYNFVVLGDGGKVYNPDSSPLSYVDVVREISPPILEEKLEGKDPYYMYLGGVLLYQRMPGYDALELDVSAVELLETSWGLGVVDAGYDLYKIFYNGIDVCIDRELGVQYLVSSASSGYAKSQEVLAQAYGGKVLQDSFDEDYAQSFFWFMKAASQGDKLSTVNVSLMLHEGLGVERDDELSFEWLSKVEDMPYGDEVTGLRKLAEFYELGIGTKVDVVQAYKYYDLVTPASAPDIARLEAQMTPEQIQEAIRLSRQWQEEHNIFVPSYYGLEYQEDGTFQ
ncbi:tetratricopeptide repeat protein [Halomonas sp. DN3]|uniref:tetratricopeptide repeat protein n=1 Tax=Halomonas sp. DN3 TaxID=2953657 RepID=UPI00209E227F|nr:tetratricopeptide repeat protein [Halomonas sp. DN3]USZ50666.1 sel1 repeat family protein [Halomonas sp. DN3]